MRIFIWSETYLPNLGGMETVAQALAEEFTRQGHDVRLLTWTKAEQEFEEGSSFPVIRLPSRKVMLETARWCDVCLHNGVMQAGLGPLVYYLLPLRKPWVLLHQFFLDQVKMRPFPKIKYDICKHFITHVFLCQEMEKSTKQKGFVFGNPYRGSVFKDFSNNERDSHIVYLGRLISYKGIQVLIDALVHLKDQGKTYRTTIIGDGQEREKLEGQIQKYGLSSQVKFTGKLSGDDLVYTLNQHQVMVIPSLWREPFGVVALEGIACGCVPIGSRIGGLVDAIGPCGLTFPKGDSIELAKTISMLIENGDYRQSFRIHASEHLSQFTAENVVQRYLQLFSSLMK
jgi:glycosyltransferase involved in cell wall biosynthesis